MARNESALPGAWRRGGGRGEDFRSYCVSRCSRDRALIGFREGLVKAGAGGIGRLRVRRGGAKRLEKSVKIPVFSERGRPKAGADLAADGEALTLEPTAVAQERLRRSHFQHLMNFLERLLARNRNCCYTAIRMIDPSQIGRPVTRGSALRARAEAYAVAAQGSERGEGTERFLGPGVGATH
jgi:hypothetical protein